MIGVDSTTFVAGAGTAAAVEARLGQIRGEIERGTHERDVEVAQERLATLSSKLAVIRVGAATDVELGDKRRRTEGALAATRGAVAEGIVPAGGGTALLRAEVRLGRPRARGRLRGRRGRRPRVLPEPLF